jgi:hypothetical protein
MSGPRTGIRNQWSGPGLGQQGKSKLKEEDRGRGRLRRTITKGILPLRCAQSAFAKLRRDEPEEARGGQ